jgi:translation initiation factor 2 alpha subunit (eIF-2alpha)
MKISALVLIVFVLGSPVNGATQSNDIQVELAKENKFVVKVMKVFNKSGNKISGIKDVESFSIEKKLFVFKSGKGKLRRIPAAEIQKIAFTRVRQGVLTGKSPKLRVIAWNGAIKNFDLAYRDVKVKDGYLFLGRNEYEKHFDASDWLRTNSDEWSDKLYKYWAKVKKKSPEIFSTDFDFQNGRGSMSRKMSAAYCKACVKIEILNIQINPATESIRLRCKEVFYDRWME